MPDHLDILSRAAAGDPEAEAHAARILLAANRQFFRCQGALSLQRCAGLPESMSKLLKQRRDYWLLIAYACCDPEDTQWTRCTKLSKEIDRMLSVFWPRWRRLADPPEDASQLRRALFKYIQIGVEMNPDNPSIPTSAQQLSNIIRTKFSANEI